MKKKILAVIMAATLALSFGSCGKKDDDKSVETAGTQSAGEQGTTSEKKDITLNLALIGDGSSKETIDKLLSQYTDKTGIKVNTIYISSGWGEYTTKIQTMIGGGEDLDACIMAVEGVKKFLSMGLAQPLNSWIDENPDVANPILNDISASQVDIFKDSDGNIYAFPFSFNNVVMHFNTKRLEEANLSLPDADWGTDEFLEYCKALTSEKDGVKQYAIALPYGNTFALEAYLLNNGASFMDPDCKKSTINSEESIEMFQLMQDLIYKYGYAPIPEENVSPVQMVMSGQVAMGSFGRSPTATYLKSDFKDVAVQYLPSFKVNQQIAGVDGFMVMKSSKHVKETEDLVAWMSSADFEGQYLSAGNIPCLNSLADEKVTELGFPENYEIFFKDAISTTYRSPSAPAQYSEVASIVNTAYSEILVNKADVRETLNDAAKQIDEAIAD